MEWLVMINGYWTVLVVGYETAIDACGVAARDFRRDHDKGIETITASRISLEDAPRKNPHP